MDLNIPDDEVQDEGWQQTGDIRLKWQVMLEQLAPEYLEAWREWSQKSAQITELDPKVREIVIITIDAIIAYKSPYIDSHIHKAFNQGATVRELLEVAITCGYLMGPHPCNFLLTALYKCIKERRELGLATPMTKSEL
jgi:alkylhydroperoxidase/carboxymuconolactone decarboxylase family protein YurZ